MRRLLPILLVLLLAALTPGAGSAQSPVTAYFQADNGAPLIGEPITLTLTVTTPHDAVVELPVFSSDWPPFRVTHIGEVYISPSGDRQIYRQELVVILWQTGSFHTPPTQITYRLASQSESGTVPVEPAYLTVPSVLEAQDLTLRPFKPPLYLVAFPSWLIPLSALLVAVLAFLAFGHMRRARARMGPAPQDPQAAPAQRALFTLSQLSENGQPPARVVILAADCLRAYLSARFAINAPDMTTSEISDAFRQQPHLPESQQTRLRHMLEQADLVKFASIEPETASAHRMLTAALKWVAAVEQSLTDGDNEA